MKREIYLDNSATTRVFPEVAEKMAAVMTEAYGNPSSMHHKGVEAERELITAKQTLADILRVTPAELVFTSCGSESDNLALIGGALANQRSGRHIISTRLEHPGVTEALKYLEGEGFEITYLPVDGDGIVSPEAVEAAVRDDTVLVSVMHTNNEIGTLEPVGEIGARIKKKNPKTLFHVDAVQGFGKAEIWPKKLGIDLLAASGHKIHGPKGVGLLYAAKGVKLRNLIYGGGQQGGLRSGTENVPGIAGMALAAQMLYSRLGKDHERLARMREGFVGRILQLADVRVNGGKTVAAHIISLSVAGVRAEVLLHALEEKGIYVSAGSACSSNRPHVSDTLQAIGLPRDLLGSTIRLSTSVMNGDDDLTAAAEALEEIIPFLRRYTRH